MSNECITHTMVPNYEIKEKAIEAWNNRATEAELRANVIDEFAELLQEKVESFQAEINGFKADVLTLDYFAEFVDEIAEQMRKGEHE